MGVAPCAFYFIQRTFWVVRIVIRTLYNSTLVFIAVTLTMANVPSKHVWKIQKSRFVFEDFNSIAVVSIIWIHKNSNNNIILQSVLLTKAFFGSIWLNNGFSKSHSDNQRWTIDSIWANLAAYLPSHPPVASILQSFLILTEAMPGFLSSICFSTDKVY